MGRIAKGWTLKWPGGSPGTVNAHVRFTHERRRYDLSTRERDPGRAAKAAACIYSDIVSGRVKRAVSGALIHPGTEVALLGAKWLYDVRNEIAPTTQPVYKSYIRAWTEVMPTIGSVGTAAIATYQRGRLGHVIKETVEKELAAFRKFLRWCEEQGMIAGLPEFPVMGRKVLGTRSKYGRKVPDYVLTEEEVEAILERLSDPFFVACWETALRPDSTIARLVPSDLTPFGLTIRAEADKNRWARAVPLTARARQALQEGLPFRKLRSRLDAFKDAAETALGRRDVTIYDLKHARCTLWVDRGAALGGISFLTGVNIDTLVERYVHPSRRSAESVLRCVTGAGRLRLAHSSNDPDPRVIIGHQREAEKANGSVERAGVKVPGIAATEGDSGALHQFTWRDPSLPAAVRVALWRRAVA